MIGNVNLLLQHQRNDPNFEVECEVMIAGAYATLPTSTGAEGDTWLRPLAEPAYRGQRHAHSALVLLLSYGLNRLGVQTETFVACIGTSNAHSIALVAALSFSVVHTVAVFDEVEMQIVNSGEMS